MGTIPFKKFIITLLFCNKEIPDIISKLNSFSYEVTEEEVSEIFSEMRDILPENISKHVENRMLLSTSDATHVEWLRYFDVFEIYDYIVRCNDNIDNKPNYFKWCEDCVWAHTHKDVMSLINIFLFNEEDIDSISEIIMVKYRRKIGVDALQLYQKIFWDTNNLSAKDAHRYCRPFRNNSLIIRQFRSGNSEIEMRDIPADSHDGCDVPFNFHDSDYIKWKIGYTVTAPTPKDFLQKVQTDSVFKYYEAMNMAQSVEVEESSGSNDIVGAFENTKSKRRNVEEMRVRLAKEWMKLYIRARDNMPDGDNKSDDFFKKMRELELGFDQCNEQIAKIDDMPDVQDDIKGDIPNL